jgi:hypothetical protein
MAFQLGVSQTTNRPPPSFAYNALRDRHKRTEDNSCVDFGSRASAYAVGTIFLLPVFATMGSPGH